MGEWVPDYFKQLVAARPRLQVLNISQKTDTPHQLVSIAKPT